MGGTKTSKAAARKPRDEKGKQRNGEGGSTVSEGKQLADDEATTMHAHHVRVAAEKRGETVQKREAASSTVAETYEKTINAFAAAGLENISGERYVPRVTPRRAQIAQPRGASPEEALAIVEDVMRGPLQVLLDFIVNPALNKLKQEGQRYCAPASVLDLLCVLVQRAAPRITKGVKSQDLPLFEKTNKLIGIQRARRIATAMQPKTPEDALLVRDAVSKAERERILKDLGNIFALDERLTSHKSWATFLEGIIVDIPRKPEDAGCLIYMLVVRLMHTKLPVVVGRCGRVPTDKVWANDSLERMCSQFLKAGDILVADGGFGHERAMDIAETNRSACVVSVTKSPGWLKHTYEEGTTRLPPNHVRNYKFTAESGRQGIFSVRHQTQEESEHHLGLVSNLYRLATDEDLDPLELSQRKWREHFHPHFVKMAADPKVTQQHFLMFAEMIRGDSDGASASNDSGGDRGESTRFESTVELVKHLFGIDVRFGPDGDRSPAAVATLERKQLEWLVKSCVGVKKAGVSGKAVADLVETVINHHPEVTGTDQEKVAAIAKVRARSRKKGQAAAVTTATSDSAASQSASGPLSEGQVPKRITRAAAQASSDGPPLRPPPASQPPAADITGTLKELSKTEKARLRQLYENLMRSVVADEKTAMAAAFYIMYFDGVDRMDFYVNNRMLEKKAWFNGHAAVDDDGLRKMTFEKLFVLLDCYDCLQGCYGRWAEGHAIHELNRVPGRRVLPASYETRSLTEFFRELIEQLYLRRMSEDVRRAKNASASYRKSAAAQLAEAEKLSKLHAPTTAQAVGNVSTPNQPRSRANDAPGGSRKRGSSTQKQHDSRPPKQQRRGGR